MKLRKIILIITIAMILLIANTKGIYATSCTISASSDKKEYTHQEKVNIKISLENVEDINKIYGVIGKIEYDKEVFEDNINNITTAWNNVEYNKSTGEFAIIRNSTIQDKKEILEVELKIKENAKLGDTVISIKDVNASDSEEDIEVKETNLVISIKNSKNGDIEITPTPSIMPTATPTNVPTSTPPQTITPGITNNPSETIKPIEKPSKKTEPKTTPKVENTTIVSKIKNIETGDKKPILAIMIIISVIIGNVIYFKYKKG